MKLQKDMGPSETQIISKVNKYSHDTKAFIYIIVMPNHIFAWFQQGSKIRTITPEINVSSC